MNIALVWILFIIGLTGTALELLGKSAPTTVVYRIVYSVRNFKNS